MVSFFNDYVKIIVDDMLFLGKGDALSVNTEECDIEEAKAIASYAIKKTGCNVKIVITKNGVPDDVIEYDAPDQLTTQMTGIAMVRLKHISGVVTIPNISNIESSSLPVIQRLGNLAQPIQIGRRVAVPWCVIPVYDQDDEKSWNLVIRKLSGGISQIAQLADYRKKYLRFYDIDRLDFTGKNTAFSVCVPENAVYCGGTAHLSDGKFFLSGPDLDCISVTLDKNSLNGHFECVAHVLGCLRNCSLTFENGILQEWTRFPELDRLLSFDEDIRKAGMLSMQDGRVVLFLGGGLSESLPSVLESEDDIPDYFNCSLYSLPCELTDIDSVTCTDCSGSVREIIRKSYFVE